MPNAGTITKIIIEQYKVDVSQAESELDKLEQKTEKANRRAKAMQTGAIKSFARSTVAIGGAALGGLAYVGKKLFDLGAEAETAEISLAGLLQRASKMQGLSMGFEQARGRASELRQTFIDLARTSPVTADEVANAFGGASFALSRAGLSFARQARIARGVAIADLSNEVKGTAAADVKQLLAGTATERMITTAVLKPLVAPIKDMIKGGDMQGAAKLLAETLTPDPAQLKAFEKSAGGTIATLTDRAKILGRKVAKPLLEYVIKKASELLDWMDKNKALVEDMARRFGEDFVGAVKMAVDLVRTLAENWEIIAATIATIATVSLVKAVAQMGALVASAGRYLATLIAASRVPAGPAGGVGGKGGAGAKAAEGLAGAGPVGAILAAGALGIAGKVEEIEGIFAKAEELNFAASRGGAKWMTREEWLGLKQENQKASDAAEQRRAQNQAIVDDLLAVTGAAAKESAMKRAAKKKRGGGRAKVAVLEVDQLKVDGESFARLASPLVLGIQQRAAVDRPLSATVGLGGLRVPNGT